MEKEEAIEHLKYHQRWRLGEDIPMLEPNVITEALEVAITALEQREKSNYCNYSNSSVNRKFIITAELRDLEKQVSLGEISYGRMVELLCEKADEYASQFKSPYPKMMMVWDGCETNALKLKVIAEYEGVYITATNPFTVIDGTDLDAWLHAKDI